MKKIYLILTVFGFVLPNIYVFKVTVESGNVLLYGDLLSTFNSMFYNDITSAFSFDLLFTVFVFMVWSHREAKKVKIKYCWIIWMLTFLFGLAGGFPLFLYLREKKIEKDMES